MKKSVFALLLAIPLALTLGACATLIEGEYEEVSTHTEEYTARETDTQVVTVSNYSALKNAIINMVQNRTEYATVRLENYEGTEETAIYQAISEVQNETPLGAYAVKHISDSNPVSLSYYQVDLKILYKHTQEEIDSIITLKTKEKAEETIKAVIEGDGSYVAFMGPSDIASESLVISFLENYYYSNPISTIAFPSVTSTLYPNVGSTRILELQFEYPYTPEEKEQMFTELESAVTEIADKISAQSEAEKLLSICRSLVDRITYDTETQEKELEALSQKPLSYTAYGALVEGAAVSESYAMALKAVCDQVGIDCTVVQGRFEEARHVWNIVKIDDDYYHVDPALCDTVGFEEAFLRRDSDITGKYWWDTGAYESCNGGLTYQAVADAELAAAESSPE